jgi:hypothetical protein
LGQNQIREDIVTDVKKATDQRIQFTLETTSKDAIDLATTISVLGHRAGWDTLENFRKALLILGEAVDQAQQKCLPPKTQPRSR